MMVAVSLPLVVAYALIVSAALIWLNKNGAGALASAIGTLAVCLAIAVVQALAFRSGPVSIRLLSLWGLCMVIPSAAVFGASRLNLLRTRPWWLMLVGPVVFVVALIAAMTVYNILFASGRPQ